MNYIHKYLLDLDISMSKNERKTESIVRKHFEKFHDVIIIEEQSSDNPKIKKLLSTASKSGLGTGFPEFIIQFRDNPDFLIVVECKADVTKHESPNRDKYRDFSVDGVLLYSSYLSKEFDVLAIAVSGEKEPNIKISHFLQVKGDKNAVEIFSNKLLSPDDYLSGYIKSPEKFRQDYEKLIDFSQELNSTLHTLQVKEDLRAILISSVLISLENKAFLNSYRDFGDGKQLINYLIQTCINQFELGQLDVKKVETLRVIYNQVCIIDSLLKDNNLKNLIISIQENIQDFIKTHEYFDVLGQLYIEFLKYANSDKGLGIVLTPPHITKFMAELGEVNKNSVVYDCCTGTCGFLVSAMEVMIEDAKGDSTIIKRIKKEQLIGVENKSHIFALACSNMFIHQDGKSNILNGDCFDENITDQVKRFRPTVGLLNPPYKSDKKNDKDEYEFILNTLECLEQGGKCVAIVPMQSALSTKGKVLEYKRKILNDHTLEAVFSMPDELFLNSKVAVVSCIMVFTAKRPHPRNKKVYFGYYKNDGFVKRKHKGRVDLYGKFEKEIKEKWITSYINKDDKAGFSVIKIVSPENEWCAEAYMETDYLLINKNSFTHTIKEYVSHFFVNYNQNINISSNSILANELQFDVEKWKYFSYSDIFIIKKGKRLTTYDQEEGDIPYISSSSLNNGLDNFIGNGHTDENCISFACYGSIGYVFYQSGKTWVSDNCNVIYIKNKELNPYVAMFLISVISLERFRFSYGMTGKSERLRGFKIKLPTTLNGEPDWEYMEDYIKSLPYSSNL